LRERVDVEDRRAEVLDVETALEVARQRRPDEVDDQHLALLTDVDAGRVVGQVDDDAALARRTAPEVDVAKRVLDVAGTRFGELLHDLLLRVELLALVEERDHDRIALDLRFERLRPIQVEDDARAVPAWITLTLRSATSSMARWVVPSPLAVSRKSSAIRGGLAIANPAGGFAGAFFIVNLTIVRPDAPFDTVSESMLLVCA
jgi:hypothetical protein